MSCQVKICGLTRASDAELSVQAGADALGVNLWPGSKRYLPLEECGWLESFAGRAARVVVLVDPTVAEAERIWQTGWFDWVQLHGDESAELIAALLASGMRLIKALRVRNESVLTEASMYLESGLPVLLDAFHGSMPGGTGKVWDWTLAAKFSRARRGRPWILSGGLNSINVSDACALVQPPAVDVASGVELVNNSRHKDPALLSLFVARAKGRDGGSDTNGQIF